jgi:glycosyltransferase involved in cell wall biosynthesis
VVAGHQNAMIVVSVICPTYNHEAFIGKALEGFLRQETTFPIEIIVHDDASTDGTADIIRSYESRFPGRLRCVYQVENQHRRMGVSLFHDLLIPMASGEFIAVCEGDDYWTDPTKLERQVAFMRRWPDLAMSFHAARVEYVGRRRPSRLHRFRGGTFVKPETVVFRGGGLYPTCSALFRRSVFADYPRFFLAAPVADSMWALNAITKGRVGYLDEVMAVYNSRVPGSWSDKARRRSLAEILQYYSELEAVRAEFDQLTGYRYSKWIKRRLSRNRAQALVDRAEDPGRGMRYDDLKGEMLLQDRLLYVVGIACAKLGLTRNRRS